MFDKQVLRGAIVVISSEGGEEGESRRERERERYRVLCIINIRGGAGSSKEKFFYDTSQFSLQEAKETLLDRTKRKLYDKWRSAGISIPFEKWSNLKEIIIIKTVSPIAAWKCNFLPF